MVIAEHPASNLVIDPSYLGIRRTADAIVIQVTLDGGRTVDVERDFTRLWPAACTSASACARRTC